MDYILKLANKHPSEVKNTSDFSEVFLMWDHGTENFRQFFKLINNHHSSIKLTGTVDGKSVDYPDITVFKDPKLQEV